MCAITYCISCSQKPRNSTVAERSFAVGTLAEVGLNSHPSVVGMCPSLANWTRHTRSDTIAAPCQSDQLQSWLKASADTVLSSFPCISPPQIVEAVGNHARFLLQLYPLFVNSLGDGEDEVCNNAVFGLGVLAANALPDIEK